MSINQSAIEDFIKKSSQKKNAKKKTRKQAYDDFQKWKEGKVDKDTTLPRPPTRLRWVVFQTNHICGVIKWVIEDNLGEMAEQADSATQMLDNNSFNAAFDALNSSIVQQIIATPPEASEERERLYMMFKSGQMFVQQLAGLINNYDLAKQQEVE